MFITISLVALILLIIVLATPVFYSYKIKDARIEFVTIGVIVIKRFNFDNIVSIERHNISDTLPINSLEMLFAMRIGNGFTGECVTIKVKKGTPSTYVITPRNVDAFIAEYNSSLIQYKTKQHGLVPSNINGDDGKCER